MVIDHSFVTISKITKTVYMHYFSETVPGGISWPLDPTEKLSLYPGSPNVMFEWLTLLLRIREVRVQISARRPAT
jgi:hypothetical protein